MVAGVAQRCGLFIGADLLGNLEDKNFVNQNLQHMTAVVAERNAAMKIWGWKYPRATDYLDELLPKLRNPRLIVVWRDLLAASARRIARGESLSQSLAMTSRIQQKNLRLTQQVTCPVLHVSYEKAIRSPIPFAEAMAAFVGGALPSDLAELVSFMEPGSYKPVGSGPAVQYDEAEEN